MLSFLKGSTGVQDSPELQAHAEQVFEMVRGIKHQLTFYFIHFFRKLFFFILNTDSTHKN